MSCEKDEEREGQLELSDIMCRCQCVIIKFEVDFETGKTNHISSHLASLASLFSMI